eukprot:augustus_masked-scaffold_3-processed-gene-1.52-mRNA-1 protein AED:1.00 eAED:1.00 QI:0/-1/0/0/-1/1/1/0/456
MSDNDSGSMPITSEMLEALRKLGSPSSRPPRLQVLRSFDIEPLLDFIVRAKRMFKSDPDLKIIDWLSGEVCYKLESHDVNLEDTKAVLEHLDSIEKLRAESRYQHSIARLANELKFPQNANSGKEAITKFFFKIREILGPEKSKNIKTQKTAIKSIIKKLPKYFQVNSENFNDLFPHVNTVEDLEKTLQVLAPIEDANIRQRRSSSKALTLHSQAVSNSTNLPQSNDSIVSPMSFNTNTFFEPIERMIIALNSIQANMNRCYNCGGTDHYAAQCTAANKPSNFTPRSNTLSSSNRSKNFRNPKKGMKPPRLIMCFQPKADPVEFVEVFGRGEWHTVKGVLDSGAGQTIGSIKSHERFCSMIFPPYSNLQVKLANNTPIPVVKVGDITVRVRVHHAEPVHLGKMRIFMVDDPNFETIYIGRDTLFKIGAMPEQVLVKMAPWQRNLLALFMGGKPQRN